MSIQSIEQGRASFAYQCVEEAITFRFKNEYAVDNIPDNVEQWVFYKYLFKKLREKDKKDKAGEVKNYLQDNKEHTLEEKEIEKLMESFRKDYRSYVRKIPMMIQVNGLGATFAFIQAKGKNGNAYELIYKQVRDWLNMNKKHYLINGNTKDDLNAIIINLPSTPYRALTNELIVFLGWIARFAEGLIEDK